MKNDAELAAVSFYNLDHDNVHAKLQTACRLAAQAYGLAKSVFILAANEEAARAMDSMLWEFPKDRFVPHVLSDEPPEYDNRVRIGCELPKDSHYLLINLTANLIAFTGKIDRVFEIVMPSEKEAASKRQSHYENLNCTIQSHSIRVAQTH